MYSKKKRKKIYLVTLTDGRAVNRIRRLLDSMRIAAAASVPVIDFSVILVMDGGEGAAPGVLDALREEYRDLPMTVTRADRQSLEGTELLTAFAAVIDDHAGEEESYFWFINRNDFLMPSVFPYLPILLHPAAVMAGDAQVFDEWWDGSDRSVPDRVIPRRKVESRLYYTWLMGRQIIPKSAMIYPAKLIKNLILDLESIAGCCDEDFFMRIACTVAVDTVPLVVAGVCEDGNHTSGNNADAAAGMYRHATAISQCVNTGIMRKIDHDFLHSLQGEMVTVRQSIPYRFMQSIMDNRLIVSLYKIVKPVAEPVIRRFIKRKNRP